MTSTITQSLADPGTSSSSTSINNDKQVPHHFDGNMELFDAWKVTKPGHNNTDTKPIKKRVRTGCFNCRRKHKKCDEQKPVCKACGLRSESCEWPNSNEPKRKNARNEKRNSSVTGSANGSNNLSKLSPSSDGSNALFKTSPLLEDQRALDNYTKNLENIDNSLSNQTTSVTNVNDINGVSRSNQWISPNNSNDLPTPTRLGTTSLFNQQEDQFGDNQQQEQHQQDLHRNSTPSSSISPGSSSIHANNDFPFLMNPQQEFGLLNYGDLKTTLRDYMFQNASNFELSTDIFNPSLDETKNITQYDESVQFLNKVEEKILMKNFLYKIAPWLDMFDLSKQIALQSVQLAKKSQCLRYAILALSARQMERMETSSDSRKSNILYQSALKYLIPTVKKAPDIGAISACVLLCVFEMMSISPEKWRYHLEGCSSLFKACGINGFSSQYERALFWVFARMDVNSAVIGEQNTMIECEKWLPDGVSIYEAGELFKKEDSYEMYANYMVFLCSRVLTVISTDNSNFEQEWEILWNEVNQWHQDRPEVMRAIIEFESSPFPEILYDNGPAISANQLYHMAMILLMENKPRLFKISSKQYKPSTWHAKQICAISLHNDHHGCWNNSVQTLYIAGRLLTHEDEHRVILDLLNQIEATTGWAMKFRAKDLTELWAQS